MFKSKKFSLLMALVFAFTVIFPVGAAFAADDEIAFSNTCNNTVKDDDIYKTTAQSLGWVKLDIPNFDKSLVDSVYVEVSLPSGVDFVNTPTTANMGDYLDYYGVTAVPTALAGCDADDLVAHIQLTDDGSKDDAYILFEFDEANSQVYIDNSDVEDEIVVDVKVTALDDSNNELWTKSDSFTVGKISSGEVAITTDEDKLPVVSVGNEKEIADITITENEKNVILNTHALTLTLPDDFEWEDVSNHPDYVTGTGLVFNGTYGLSATVTNGTEAEELIVSFSGSTRSLADEIVLEDLEIIVAPGAPEGDIEVEVEPNDAMANDDVYDADEIVVAVCGESDLTVTADNETGMEEYMRMASIDELWEIKLETSGEFNEGDEITLSLPDGFEFYEKLVEKRANEGNISDYLDYLGLFDGEQSIWFEVNSQGDGENEIELANLWVAALPGAQYGDINVEISCDCGEATVKAGYVKPAVMIKPEQTYVSPGLEQLAGNITFTETDKDAVIDGMMLEMVLPSGVEFASTPTVTINGEEIDEVEVGPEKSSGGDYDDNVLRITVDKVRNSQIDTMTVSDIKYNVDSRYKPGDVIKVSLGGNDSMYDNFNQLAEYGLKLGVKQGLESPDLSSYQFKDEADDIIAEVPNAIVIDPNQVTASFTLGDEGVYVVNGRTLVQVNLLCDTLGLQKSWDPATKTAYFVKAGKTVAFPVGENKILVNGTEVPVDQGAMIMNGYTCATLRGLEMTFGGELSWDGETKTATFKFNK